MKNKLNVNLMRENSTPKCNPKINRWVIPTFLVTLTILFLVFGNSFAFAQSSSTSINFMWRSGDSPIIQSVENFTIMSIRGASTFENLPTNNEIEYQFSEQKNGTDLMTNFTQVPNAFTEDYRGSFGTWQVWQDQHLPNGLGLDFTNPEIRTKIQDLKIGDVVKTVATIKLFDTSDNEKELLVTEEVVVTINGPQQPEIEFTWGDSQTGLIVSNPNASYEDLTATLRKINFRGTYQNRIKFIEQKNNESPIEDNSGETDNMFTNFSAMKYGQQFQFGNWYWATDESQVLFKPNPDAINQLTDGDVVITKLQIDIFDSRPHVREILSTHPEELIVAIRGSTTNLPSISLNWNSDQDDKILQSSNEFVDRIGTITLSNFNAESHNLEISVSETIEEIKTNDIIAGPVNNNAGFEAMPFGSNFQYGSWYFAVDNTRFLFRPSPSAINNMDSGDVVNTEMQITLTDSINNVRIVTETVSVTITGDKPTIRIRAENPTVMQRDPVELIVSTGGVQLQRDLIVNLNYSDTVSLITWRLPPRTVTIRQGNSSKSFKIKLNGLSAVAVADSPIELIVTIAESEDYLLRDSFRVLVRITKTNLEDQDRISVADAVVSAILRENLVESETERASNSQTSIETIAISTIVQQIEEGESAEIFLQSSGKLQSDLKVSMQISQTGEFLAQIPSNNVIMKQGQSITNYVIKTANDEDAESDGKIVVELLKNHNYLIDSSARKIEIIVSDQADRESKRSEVISAVNSIMIPQLTRDIGNRSINVLNSRFNHVTNREKSSFFNFNGNTNIIEILSDGDELVESYKNIRQKFLRDSSFSFELLPNAINSDAVEIWGQSNFQEYNDLSYDTLNFKSGNLFTGYAGLDYYSGQDLLLGLSTSILESQVAFGHVSKENSQFSSNLIGIHPYIGWNLRESDLELLISSSYGAGEIEIAQGKYQSELLRGQYGVLSVSGRKGLISRENLWFGQQSQLSLNGESWYSTLSVNGELNQLNQFQSQVGLFRIFLKGEHQHKFVNGSILEPEITIGILGEKHDQNSISRLVVESITNYHITTNLQLRGHGEFQFWEEDEFSDYNLLGELVYDQGLTGLGLKLGWEFSDRTSRNRGSTKLLISENFVSNSNNDYYSGQPDFNAELHYGINLLDEIGTLTPFTKFSMTSNQEQELQLGSKIDIGQSFDIKLTNQLNHDYRRITNQNFKVTGKLMF